MADVGLERFIEAQEHVIGTVLAELGEGRKRTHWMWFVFPQIDGLGSSPTARYFAIRSLEEAERYVSHPVLGPRLKHCTELVLRHADRAVGQIFGHPDDLKFHSSMTLFSRAIDDPHLFLRALDAFFGGQADERTLALT